MTQRIQLEIDELTLSGATSCIRAISQGSDAPVDPENEPLELPTQIGRFLIIHELARGGMGVVLKAWDPHLVRNVAVKILHSHLLKDNELKERFYNEARINGQLEHPSIVSVHELGMSDDGRPFFAMRLLEGSTLARLLADRSDHRIQQNSLLRMFEKICEGVAYAHARGVIHRDLKPSNIIVGDFGMVKIMDWGLAKELRPLPVSPEAFSQLIGAAMQPAMANAMDASLQTRENYDCGIIVGTPAYLAPEQARGEISRVDERSDVFGLGAILCYILTGSGPYPELQPTRLKQAMRAHLGPAYAKLDACQAEPEVVDLAKRCLAAQAEDRPRNGGEVAAAMTQYLESDLRRAERDLVRFFELSLDLFCIAGMDGRFRRINGNFSRLLGYSDEEMLKRPFTDYIHPEDLQPTAEAMSKLSVGLPVVQFTNRYLHSDGHYIYLEWVAKSESPSGNIYAAARDVSNRHQSP